MFLKILTLTFILYIYAEEDVIIQVKQGPVRGHVAYAGEREVYAFKNIPYAKQPVGDLRLQKPQELDTWISVQDVEGNGEIRCPQLSFPERQDLNSNLLGQEDCLVLDIYVRKGELKKKSVPVLVYFHGGGFRHGSKEGHGPDFLLRFNNIILVVPNYRLGILGFLNFQKGLYPGNLALWDQHEALKWVYRNIDSFGGDPFRITISGHEAGATSVGLHVLAPVSHGFFQGAISCSGSAFSPNLIVNEQTYDVTNKVAYALGCPTESKEEMKTCIINASVKDILQAQRILKNVDFIPVAVVDDAHQPFVDYPPKLLYRKGYQKNVNYLLGFTENEAAFDVSREFPKVLRFQHLDKMIDHFLRPYFDNFSNLEMVIKAAKYHYLKGMVIPSFESIEPKIAKIMTDFLYESPMFQVMKEHSKATENVYMYVFTSREFNSQDWNCGPGKRCYGNEPFVFNKTTSDVSYEGISSVEKVIETVSTIWGNFVKFGFPEVEGRWKKFGSRNTNNYAEISDTIRPKVNHNREDIEFWTGLVADLMAVRNSTQEQLASLPSEEYPIVDKWGAAGLAILCGVVCIAIIGLVLITKRRTFTMSIVPVSSLNKDISA